MPKPTPPTYLEHEVEREGLGEGVLLGRFGVVLVEHLAQLVGAVGVRLPLHTQVLLALLLFVVMTFLIFKRNM